MEQVRCGICRKKVNSKECDKVLQWVADGNHDTRYQREVYRCKECKVRQDGGQP